MPLITAVHDDQILEAKKLLAEHGFQLTVGGCGCCGSPWMRLTYQGRDIVFDETNTHLRMRDEVDMVMHCDGKTDQS